MTQVIEKLGGEYEIRTHVHGFAIDMYLIVYIFINILHVV